MNQQRFRSAVTPLRRRFPSVAAALPAVNDLVAAERPEEPMHSLRPATIEATARAFVAAFAGDVLYAVKCNPEPAVLRALRAGGVRHFDCASLAEVALVRQMFPDADIHLMHPVKARGTIRESWARHGVRDFAVDSAEELAKVTQEVAATGVSGALGLIVRLALPKGTAVLDLTGKFGAAPEAAVALLRAARPLAARLGVSFHVGSQCLEPLAWRDALDLAGRVVRGAGVEPDAIDVGGGFPVSYPDVEPPRSAPFWPRSTPGSSGLACGTRGSGRSPAVPWWRGAPRWSCRCSTDAATRCSSATASMAALPMPERSASAIRCG